MGSNKPLTRKDRRQLARDLEAYGRSISPKPQVVIVRESKGIITDTFPYGFVLFIVFLALQLSSNIHWSWWWITAPLWAGVAIVFVTITLAITVAIISAVLGGIIKAIRRK